MKRLRRALSISSRDVRLVHVKWNSRTAAFDNNSVEGIIRKACTHFRLGPVEHEYVLVTSTSDGGRIEVTDDLLKRLPDGSWLDLVRVSAFERLDAAKETDMLGKPQSSLNQAKCSDTPLSTTKTSSTRYNHSPETVPVTQPRPSQRLPPPLPQPMPRQQPMPQSPPPLPAERGIPISLPIPVPTCIPIPTSIPSPPPMRTHIPSRSPTPSDESSYARYGGTIIRKPVVYLFPPRPLPEVVVSVRLVPQWSFTHIYPPVEPKREPDGRQAISWTVSANPDGTLVEHGTALELAYLFWEAAAARNAAPPSPPLSPADGAALASTPSPSQSPSPSSSHEYFDPAAPLLDPSSPTAVLLPFAALLPYLDGALQRLTLHTAARTDFVTYWLPLLAKQPFVALRFLPQPVYERAAELVVHPAPDVVTRVMMLFRGVPAAEAESDVWAAARGRVGEVDWAAVVGVKPWATDKARFRVLEWGAMEVL